MSSRPRFQLQAFAPGWGATVMGTGVTSVILSAWATIGFAPGLTQTASRIMLIVTLALAIPVVSLMITRLITHRDTARTELAHPVMGAMHVTLGGALLVPAVALGRAGAGWIPEAVLHPIIYALTAAGSLITLIIGWIFLTTMFRRGDVPIGQVTGAWFIPPVLTVVIPLALVPTFREGSTLSQELVWLSWAALGTGSMLYLALTAVLVYRHVSAPLPPAALAPTLIIGMGPAGLIGLDVLVLSNSGGAYPFAVAMWGFGLWWAIAALIVIRHGYPTRAFGLPAWAYTFPFGAWVVAGIMIGHTVGSLTILWVSSAAGAIMFAVWAWVAYRTLRGVLNGQMWVS
ncbi:MAG TPA: hypothetical protein VK054_01910 [Beutenbergiaceae bacterium]|nr:hypothetical protein [Beutenbergiaceae bacterium]